MLKKFGKFDPQIGNDCFVAESADIIGQVVIEDEANVWYNTVVRGDMEPIYIGAGTNIQDLSMVHTSHGFPTRIGKGVTVGHGAIIHGCTIEDNVLVGMGAIVLDGAYVEKDVLIGAGALIPPGKRIPSGSLVMGSPAKVVRTLSEEEVNRLRESARNYVELSKQYT
jgi:carbonic anhydrase/acetyltransferase-like protein (isoleucine patch superfamily)